MNNTEALENLQSISRLYEKTQSRVAARNGLTCQEADVLAFLFFNPTRNTARDIVILRRLPKATVSVAVDSLLEKGLVTRKANLTDRRVVRLAPTNAAESVIASIKEGRERVMELLFQGFSAGEKELYAEMNSKIGKNAKRALERYEK